MHGSGGRETGDRHGVTLNSLDEAYQGCGSLTGRPDVVRTRRLCVMPMTLRKRRT